MGTPTVIVLLAAAAAAPVLLALWGRRHGRRTPAPLAAMQVLAVLLAGAALARPSAPVGPAAARPYMLLRDVSASLRGQDANLDLPADLPRETYVFADGVAPLGTAVGQATTLLAPALRLALARRGGLPAAGKQAGLAGLIVQTDGRFADSDWRSAAAAAGRAGLPALVVPMDSPPADARIADFAARRAPDGAVELSVSLASNALDRRTVAVRRTGLAPPVELLSRRLDLLADQPAGLHLTDADAPRDAAAVYEARLSAGDEFPENDSAAAIALPRVRRAALVGGGAIAAEALARQADMPVVAVRAAEAPATAAGWMGYCCVVLQDANGTLLAPASRAALAEYVRSGGGLVLVGAAPHGSPADRDEPLSRVAALVANPHERRPLKVTLVLDASGSMGEAADAGGTGGTKFDQAVEAAMSLRRHLTDADALSAIVFSDSPRRVYDSGPRPVDFAALRQALRAVRPAGPTDVEKALFLAAGELAAEGRDGLVLVVSDLLTRPFQRADALAAALRQHKLTLAVVQIASSGSPYPDHPSDLEALVRALGSPAVVSRPDLSGLADVFARFLRQARPSALRTGAFEARVVREAFGTPPGPLPRVQSYLLSAPRDSAVVLAKVGPEGDPLLARRQVGLGRSVTLALDPRAGANPAWELAGRLTGMTAGVARVAAAPVGDPRFACTADRAGDLLRVSVEAADANGPMNGLRLTALVGGVEDDAGRPVELPQTAPGRYAADLPAPAGAAALVLRADGAAVWRTALPQLPAPELARLGADWANLRSLAELTGGRIVARVDLAGLARSLDRRRRMELWPWLLAAAAAVMLLEWSAAKVHHRRT